MAWSSLKYAPRTARFPVRRFGPQAFPGTILGQAARSRRSSGGLDSSVLDGVEGKGLPIGLRPVPSGALISGLSSPPR
jgi:hypothetical protein